MKNIYILLFLCATSAFAGIRLSAVEDIPWCLDTLSMIPFNEEINQTPFNGAIDVLVEFILNDDDTTHRRYHFSAVYLPCIKWRPFVFARHTFSKFIITSLGIFRYYICTNAP